MHIDDRQGFDSTETKKCDFVVIEAGIRELFGLLSLSETPHQKNTNRQSESVVLVSKYWERSIERTGSVFIGSAFSGLA